MKNFKNFVVRHPLSSVWVMLGLFFISLLLVLVKPLLLSLLLFSLMSAIFLVTFRVAWNNYFNYDWICTKCGKMEISERHKFCSACGGIMHTVKRGKVTCSRSHRVGEYDKFCPKCGVPLINLKLGGSLR